MPVYKGNVKPDWKYIEKITGKLLNFFSKYNDDQRDTIRIAITELLENTIKHGISEEYTADFAIRHKGDKLEIIVSNKAKSAEHATNAIDRIDKTKNAKNLFELYSSRLQEINAEMTTQNVMLGLYRIAYEAEFKLDYKFKNDILTIIATKELALDGQDSDGKVIVKDFKFEDLQIQINEQENDVLIEWIGKSSFRNPSQYLNPYLKKLISVLIGKSVTCNFTKLAYMSSSTVPPIIKFAGLLNENKIKSVIYYDGSSNWQRASFKAFETIAKSMEYVEVKPG